MFGSKNGDAAFFDAFSRHVDASVEAANLLVELLATLPRAAAPEPYRTTDSGVAASDGEDVARLTTRIKEAERNGDRITHETIKRLRENWITPLDRNDIHRLIGSLDDVLDIIEAASNRIQLFELRMAPPEASALADILARCLVTLAKAVALLPTMKKDAGAILALCIEVNRLEEEADGLHRKALGEIFKPGGDPLLVMKWRDVLDALEDGSDRCEDVADVIEGVVLEYA